MAIMISMPENASDILKNADRIVIKVGSALLCDVKAGSIRQKWLQKFCSDVAALHKSGKDIVIVSSGGVALGRTTLSIDTKKSPSSIPLEYKQAASAIGQFHMFSAYYQAFEAIGIKPAQILLTMAETENRKTHLNARETLSILLENRIIPIINENDAISTHEIRFGDNDRLAARIGQMVDADAILILSTIDGLYTDNPDKNLNAKHIPIVEKIAQKYFKMAGEALAGLSTGGMKSKVEAADHATRAGIPLIIAKGLDHGVLEALLKDPSAKSTIFLAQKPAKSARQIWLGSNLSPKGSVFIDDGALQALRDGKSLLPVGVTRVEGDFDRGDVIEVKTTQGYDVGLGLVTYSRQDADKIIGLHSTEIETILGYAGRHELIHRNDMVLSG